MNVQDLQAKLLSNVANKLKQEYSSINAFNSTAEVTHMKEFHDDLHQRLAGLQKKQEDIKLQQTLANSETERKKKIAELKDQAVQKRAETAKLWTKIDKDLQEQQKEERTVQQDLDIFLNQSKNLENELNKQLQILHDQESANERALVLIETTFDLPIKSRNDIQDFINIYSKDVLMVHGPASNQQLLNGLKNIVAISKMDPKKPVELQKQIKEKTLTQEFQGLFLELYLSTTKHEIPDREQLITAVQMLNDPRLDTAIKSYCRNNWSVLLEMEFKKYINKEFADLQLKDRGTQIQGACYETDQKDLNVVGMICFLLAIQGLTLKLEKQYKVE